MVEHEKVLIREQKKKWSAGHREENKRLCGPKVIEQGSYSYMSGQN